MQILAGTSQRISRSVLVYCTATALKLFFFCFVFVNKAISNPHFNTIYVNTDEDCHFMGVKLATHTQMITTK